MRNYIVKLYNNNNFISKSDIIKKLKEIVLFTYNSIKLKKKSKAINKKNMLKNNCVKQIDMLISQYITKKVHFCKTI